VYSQAEWEASGLDATKFAEQELKAALEVGVKRCQGTLLAGHPVRTCSRRGVFQPKYAPSPRHMQPTHTARLLAVLDTWPSS